MGHCSRGHHWKWDNDANLMYFGVLAIGLIGGIVAHFEPRGMERAMYATAGAQIVVFVIALVAGWGFTGPITAIFVAMWLGSGLLFQKAAVNELLLTSAKS